MEHLQQPPKAPFTAPERDLLRRELCLHFGQDPAIADGLFLRTWGRRAEGAAEDPAGGEDHPGRGA